MRTSFIIINFLFLFGAVGCAQESSSSAEQIIEEQSAILDAEIATSPFKTGQPVFIRIVKTVDGSLKDGFLELYMQNSGDEFALYKSWPICNYSGELGPKLKEGDGQSPEGFYFVRPSQMNPNSSYHLSFNLGFPNAYDKALGRTGSYLMVHGSCVSVGCYAMTDDVIEEIYTLMSRAFENGQPFVRVHVFPFPMTDDNLLNYEQNSNMEYWKNLKEGWDWFEENRLPPNVTVTNKRYLFSAAD